eukprot:scaffold141450_cov205-Phaeocystis_antarctica.AAC.1
MSSVASSSHSSAHRGAVVTLDALSSSAACLPFISPYYATAVVAALYLKVPNSRNDETQWEFETKRGDTTTKVFRLLITPSSIAMKTLVDVAVLSCSVPSSATWAWP